MRILCLYRYEPLVNEVPCLYRYEPLVNEVPCLCRYEPLVNEVPCLYRYEQENSIEGIGGMLCMNGKPSIIIIIIIEGLPFMQSIPPAFYCHSLLFSAQNMNTQYNSTTVPYLGIAMLLTTL